MHDVDQDFRTFRDRGDPTALARVFDALAPELFVVARHWIGDAGEAEDCVQQTFVRAVEKAESWDGVRPVGAWLGGILLGELRNARRRRRAAEEPSGDAADPLADEPIDRAAEAEAAELMARAAASLTPPYREVVLLRMRHDLDLVEIAGVLDRPYETVRTQLRRALAMLRRKLPRGLALGGMGVGGGMLDGARRGALAAAVRGTIMPLLWVAGSAKAVLLVGLALIALLGVGWWAVGAPADLRVPTERSEASSIETARAPTPLVGGVGFARAEVATGPGEPVPGLARPALLPLGGRVVASSDGAPIANAEVVVSHCDADRFMCLDAGYRDRVDEITRARTDVDGSFVADVDPRRLYRVEIRAAGFATWRFVDRAAGDGQEFALHTASRVTVRVVRADTQEPVEGASVRVHQGGRQGVAIHASTDAAGRAMLDGAAPVKVTIAASIRGFRDGYRLGLDLADRRDEPIEVTLAPTVAEDYVVLDAATEQPIPNAVIQIGLVGAAPGGIDALRADAHGRFRAFLGTDPVHVEALGYARWPRRGDAVDGGPRRLLLEPSAAFTGRVVTTDGAALADAYVAALAQVEAAWGVSADWVTADVDDQGRFVVDGLREGFVYDLHLRRPGCGARLLRLPEPVAGARTDLGDLRLEPGTALEGRVVDADGRGMVDVEVSLHGADAAAAELVDDIDPADVTHYAVNRSGRSVSTDVHARFRFPDLAAGEYHVVIAAGPPDQRTRGPFVVSVGPTVDVGGLQMALNRTLSGAVLGPNGPLEDVKELRLLAVLPRQSPRMHRVAVAAGRYTVTGIPAGDLLLCVIAPVEGLVLPPVPLDAVAAELYLRFVPALSITGRVVDREGRPTRALVSAYRSIPRIPVVLGHECDADGGFRIEVDPIFVGRLSARLPDADPHDYGGVDDVVAGSADVVIRLP